MTGEAGVRWDRGGCGEAGEAGVRAIAAEAGEGRLRRERRGEGVGERGEGLHTAAVKNTVERRFKALDNLADAHILRGGWIYFEFLTERQ